MSYERSKRGRIAAARYGMREDVRIFVEGADKPSNMDRLFFKRVFSGIQMAVLFVPSGGKKNLLRLARQIDEDGISNQFVIVDADYQRFFDDVTMPECAFATLGYSWENDFLNSHLFLRCLAGLRLRLNAKQLRALDALENDAKRAALRDIYYMFEGRGPLGLPRNFNRNAPLSIVCLKSLRITPELIASNKLTSKRTSRNQLSRSDKRRVKTYWKFVCAFGGTRVFFGKTLFYLVWKIWRLGSGSAVSRQVFFETCLDKAWPWDEVREYYFSQLSLAMESRGYESSSGETPRLEDLIGARVLAH